MRVIGKVELDRKHLGEGAEGVPRQTKVGLDLKVYDEEGELDNEEVIAGGFAHKTRLGFRHEDGSEHVLYEGKGAQVDAAGKVKRFPKGHAAANKAVPEGGYILEGCGSSAMEHSNGFRIMANFKKLPEGQYTAFGEVTGAGVATFKGATFRVGRAKRKGHQ